MTEWFTVEQMQKDTYAISEMKHWEETHCYLLTGSTQALLIDTGLGVGNIHKVVERLTDKPIVVATTHVHWDHIGGHRFFESILVGEKEESWLTSGFPIPLTQVKANLLREPCDFPVEFDPQAYEIYQGKPERVLRQGDTISLGDREITVFETPGHSPGHLCFYEEERKTLYSGDLIYAGCLDAFYPTTDPKKFHESVKKMSRLPLEGLYPGHHALSLPVTIIDEIATAFDQLEEQGKLNQGAGLFEYSQFQIHI